LQDRKNRFLRELSPEDQLSEMARRARLENPQMLNASGVPVAMEPGDPGWRGERPSKVRLGSPEKPHGAPGTPSGGAVEVLGDTTM
jgi:hypothetical protein